MRSARLDDDDDDDENKAISTTSKSLVTVVNVNRDKSAICYSKNIVTKW